MYIRLQTDTSTHLVSVKQQLIPPTGIKGLLPNI